MHCLNTKKNLNTNKTMVKLKGINMLNICTSRLPGFQTVMSRKLEHCVKTNVLLNSLKIYSLKHFNEKPNPRQSDRRDTV